MQRTLLTRTLTHRPLVRYSSTFLPSFAPSGSTSASTKVPYGDPSLASAAYLPAHPDSPFGSGYDLTSSATNETPLDLTPKQRTLLERIIRVDQAGELGANYIYQGQLAVLKHRKDKDVVNLVQHMWDSEKKHIATFDKIVSQHGVRPTFLYPIWKVAAFTLGAGTAMMGKRSAMACTEAVETMIGKHYNDQLLALSDPVEFPSNHPSIVLLRKILAEFRDDELEHLDTAVANESQQAPIHAMLSAIIAVGCKSAIAVTERV